MEKITYEDLHNILSEIELGLKDKTRTLDSIGNSKIKDILTSESKLAIKSGITSSIMTAGAGTTIGVATGALAGTIGGVGTGIVASGLTTVGATSFGVAAGVASGAAAGSAVPVVGTIIGAAVGATVGIFAGSRIAKKNEQENEQLRQEVEKKWARIFRDIESEFTELKSKYGEAVEQIARYRYIISLLIVIISLMRLYNLGEQRGNIQIE